MLCVCIQTEFLPVYQQQLKDMIIDQVDTKGPARDRPLEGLKVVVNAGNGNGGFLAETLSEVRTPPLPSKVSCCRPHAIDESRYS